MIDVALEVVPCALDCKAVSGQIIIERPLWEAPMSNACCAENYRRATGNAKPERCPE